MTTNFDIPLASSRDEQRAALAVGARVLCARWPQQSAYCTIPNGSNRVDACARWKLINGRMHVEVTRRWDEQLIARSKPVDPFELDEIGGPR